jgi:maleamate amidohydrolase
MAADPPAAGLVALDLAAAAPAVLVVDMQVAFVSAGGAFGNDAGALIERLNAFLPACRGRGLPVIFTSYLLRADLADAGLLRGNPAAVHLSEDAPGAGIDPRLQRTQGDLETRRNRPSALHGGELESLLRGLDADALILTGVSINNAISSTARDAFARDLPALVVSDLVGEAPWEPAEHELYLATLATWTAEVASAAEVAARLEARPGSASR